MSVTIAEPDLWLLSIAIAANLVMGIYHLMLMFEAMKQNPQVRALTAVMLGIAYIAPPTLLVLAVAKIGHIV